MKVFIVVLALAVAASAIPRPNEEEEAESGEYKVEDDRFDDAAKRFVTKVSDDDVDVFRTHHQYVQPDGTIVGEYAQLAADGKTLQIVKYTAGIGGYQAKVTHTDDLSVF